MNLQVGQTTTPQHRLGSFANQVPKNRPVGRERPSRSIQQRGEERMNYDRTTSEFSDFTNNLADLAPRLANQILCSPVVSAAIRP
jgi:hypothetical protein